MKEAVGKCLGEGISDLFKNRCILSLWPVQCVDITTPCNQQKIYYEWQDLLPDYTCCVAVDIVKLMSGLELRELESLVILKLYCH